MNKFCPICQQTLDISNFGIRKKTKTQSYCKACHAKKHREWWAVNRLSKLDRNRKYKRVPGKKISALICKAKSVPCIDCKQSFHPVCMDFDHVKGQKLFTIGSCSNGNNSIEKILVEMAKCEVVCSNCHRVRTRNRRLAQSS